MLRNKSHSLTVTRLCRLAIATEEERMATTWVAVPRRAPRARDVSMDSALFLARGGFSRPKSCCKLYDENGVPDEGYGD